MSSTNPYGQNLSSPPAVDGNYYSRPTAPPSSDGRPAPPSRLNIAIPDNDAPRPHGRPSIPNNNSSYKSTGGVSKAGGGGHVGFEGGPDASVEQLPYGFAETTQAGGSGADVRRKKSLVRPERERHNPNDRLAHYRQHAANMESNGQGRIGVIPSGTGNVPNPNRLPLRRGKSILAREEDQVQESGLALFKRNTVRRKNTSGGDEATRPAAAKKTRKEKEMEKDPMDRGFWGGIAPGPVDGWMIYCFLLTCWVPGFILRNVFGKRNPEAQRAWREKMGLVGVIALVMLFVGYLTFGFTITVCGTPPNRYHSGSVQTGSLIINGLAYDLGDWKHPAAGVFNGTTNPLYMDDWKAGGMDASFMFQKVNDNCLGLITPAPDTAIKHRGQEMAWYFPCHLRSQNGSSPDLTNITSPYTCHTAPPAREQYSQLKASGEVYFDWKDIRDPSRNLAVYQGTVLDLNLLQWLSTTQTEFPQLYTQMMNGNASFQGLDITMLTARMGYEREMACLMDTVTVGFISAKTIGCIASDIVLYTSLIFIIGIVAIKFAMAVAFGWFLSWRLGSFKGETYAQRMARAEAIESWTDDIYRSAPSRYRPNVPAGGKGGKNRGAVFLPTTSRFSKADSMMVTSSRPSTAYGGGGFGRSQTTSTFGGKGLLSASPLGAAYGNTPPGSPMVHSSQSSNSLPWGQDDSTNDHSYSDPSLSACPFPLNNVIPQPPPDYEPFNFPLMHNILLVTAYSESIEGLRTTIDSLATTDYPNSHKVILVIADGMVRGSGSKLRTPDIVLGMMKEFVIPPEEVQAHSYVAIADGHKKHNMAKVYAGFYEYDDDTVEVSKQQRVPMILVAKTGNPLEVHDAKPGNRGKRDSQIIIMGFLQKVMFDERMTTFEYEFFNSLWRCTGVSPDQYVGMLCVDADTKVFPDSLTRMTAAMHHDPEIMGLCGETKIANKTETWVTMIQVFEYYISHHQTKAFEAVFGGVTCLPGCFSMYRIKAPKGDTGYWVPIIANPDIVEHYSENVVDTLHKKNLLLLGEDRYLSTLMLKTFPKRKMMFIPQAVCKTVVPDTFKILLSQRRRWINSTIHNLFELLFVRDLCGTFCFSMQFVVLVDLVGTLALPAAISFTIYIVIISIIPSQPTPTVSLILLALILGLPALLIVITSRKIAYVGWMLIYLCSLPIWNFVLPVYAYWHFDDFSWGETRKIEGEGTGKPETGHGDKEGVFDSTSIVMKRWAEFERERRWRSGTQSRDSNYDLAQRSTSPRRRDNRYSLSSTFDAHSSAAHSSAEGPFANPRPSQHSFVGGSSMPNRADSVPLLALPAPLGPRVYSQDSSAGTSDEDNNTYRHGASSSESGPFGDSNYADSSSRPEMSPVVGRGGLGGQSFNSIGSRDSPSTSTYDEDSRSSRLSHGQGVDLVDQGYLPPSQPAKVGRVARNAQRRSGSIVTGQSSPMGTASSRGGMGGGPASPTSPRYSQQPGGYARFDRSQQ